MKDRTQRTLMHIVLIILMGYPIIRPIGIPINVSEETRIFYNAIEEVDSKGNGIIVAEMKLDPSSYGSCEGSYMAILKHLLGLENTRVLFFTPFSAPAYGQFIAALDKLPESLTAHREYGKDWVILGFIPGEEATMATLAKDLVGTFVTDHLGADLSSMEVMQGIPDASAWDLFVGITGGFPDNGPIIRQIVNVYGTPFYCMTTGAALPASVPFTESGEIKAIISGDHGGQYELLIGSPGVGISSADSQSLAHIYAILMVFAGNILLFTKKKEDV
jgi:hypothetical protein